MTQSKQTSTQCSKDSLCNRPTCAHSIRGFPRENAPTGRTRTTLQQEEPCRSRGIAERESKKSTLGKVTRSAAQRRSATIPLPDHHCPAPQEGDCACITHQPGTLCPPTGESRGETSGVTPYDQTTTNVNIIH